LLKRVVFDDSKIQNYFNSQIVAYPNVQIPGSLQSQKAFDTLLSLSHHVYFAPLWSLRWSVYYWQKGACKTVTSLIIAIIHTNRTYKIFAPGTIFNVGRDQSLPEINSLKKKSITQIYNWTKSNINDIILYRHDIAVWKLKNSEHTMKLS
jgi:hypothetical protein